MAPASSGNRSASSLSLLLATAIFASASTVATILLLPALRRRRSPPPGTQEESNGGYAALIGNTPLVELQSLSKATGCRILAKAEYLNPGGTSKDRVALRMIQEAERAGLLKPGGTVVEGTSGSTGIALASLCRARGYRCLIVMPDDQAAEKVRLLQQYGAEVEVVKPAGIANPNHYYNRARTRAQELSQMGKNAIFMDQFETMANFHTHYHGTGPELWRQLEEGFGLSPDAFVMSAGTGGTIAGVSRSWKEMRGKKVVKVYLVDPPGSALFNKVKFGVCYASEQKERGVRRHRYDSLAEGIGLDRVTANFQEARVDDAFRVTDQEAVDMAHFLLQREGLFVGSSTAMNVVGAVRAAWELGRGHTVVTVLCDSGQRHLTRFWSREWVEGEEKGVRWPERPWTDLRFLKRVETE
ncbi:cysteine synthase [Nannochloropsis oceanica]